MGQRDSGFQKLRTVILLVEPKTVSVVGGLFSQMDSVATVNPSVVKVRFKSK